MVAARLADFREAATRLRRRRARHPVIQTDSVVVSRSRPLGEMVGIESYQSQNRHRIVPASGDRRIKIDLDDLKSDLRSIDGTLGSCRAGESGSLGPLLRGTSLRFDI